MFDVEDTPGSREINVYPFYAEARIDFRITSYFQDLDDPDTYTDEQVSFLTQDKTASWYNIPDTNEGFTIVSGSYRSKK